MTAITWTKHALSRGKERGIHAEAVDAIVRAPFLKRIGAAGAIKFVGRAVTDRRWRFVTVVAVVECIGGDTFIRIITTY